MNKPGQLGGDPGLTCRSFSGRFVTDRICEIRSDIANPTIPDQYSQLSRTYSPPTKRITVERYPCRKKVESSKRGANGFKQRF